MSDEKIRKTILEKLYRQGCIGGKHTAIEGLAKGFPSDKKGEAKEESKKLIKEGLLLQKSTHYGLQVSLNPQMIPVIERILGVKNEGSEISR